MVSQVRIPPRGQTSTLLEWSCYRYWRLTIIIRFFPDASQVLTGEPLQRVIPIEHLCNIMRGVRPSKPANAKAIGISETLWGVIQKCWDDDRTRRPRIREVVANISDAAANWHTDMPPSYAQPEAVDVVDKLNEPERGGSLWLHLFSFFFLLECWFIVLGRIQPILHISSS